MTPSYSPRFVETHLPAADLRSLLETQYHGQNLVSFGQGDAVPLPPDRIWVVYRGAIVLETGLPNGSTAVVGLVGPGTIASRALGGTLAYRAIALTTVDLLPLSWQQVQRSPLLARNLLSHALRRLNQATELKAMVTLQRADDRLWELLKLLNRDFGQSVPGGRRLTVRFTHQQLGSAAQLSRVTVSRLIREFQERGLIQVDGDRHLWFPAALPDRPSTRHSSMGPA